MDYFHKLKSTVTGVLPGNAVTREFDVSRHVASAGPGLLWKVYDGVNRSTKEEASVFVFEKKAIDSYSKRDKDIITELLRSGVQKMTRLRHPKILSVLHPLEESRDSLAFATERVFASVANVLGHYDNMPSNSDITDCKLYDVEIKYGLLQVVEGLAFLHNDAKIVHGNICPESIVVVKNGAWKIAGLDFARLNTGSESQPAYECTQWEPGIPHVAQPKLDYLAPEHVLNANCTRASDMFACGNFIHAVFNRGKPAMQAANDLNVYKRNVRQMHVNRDSLPGDLQQTVPMLLNIEPTIRPDADQTSKIQFFEDVGVNTLLYLDTLIQRDNFQKSQFFKGLPQIIPKLPKRVHVQRMLPCMVSEFVNHSMIPFILPSVIMISENLTQAEYCQHVLPSLIPVFRIQHPVQIILICLQNMDIFLKKTPSADIKNHILPLVYNALESDTPQIQQMCLTVVPTFAHLVEYSTLKAHIFPRIKKLALHTGLLTVRVQCLVCIGKLLEEMDKWFVLEEVLPSLAQVPSREPAVLMSILGIYQVAFSHPKLGITKEQLASKVIPFLVPLCIDSNLNLSQFNAFIALVKEMVNKIENEHRSKLEQLNAMQLQQDQRSIDFSSEVPARAGKPGQLVDDGSKDTMMDKFLSGFGISSLMNSSKSSQDAQNLASPTSATNNSGGDAQNNVNSTVSKPPEIKPPVSLSLEEKRRLANEQQQNALLKSQPVLSPSSQPGIKSPQQNTVKDLTSGLASTNMMNNRPAPQTKSPMGTKPMYTGGYTGSGVNPMGNTGAPMNNFSSMDNRPMGFGSTGAPMMGNSFNSMGSGQMGMGSGSQMGLGSGPMGMGTGQMGMGNQQMGMGTGQMGMGNQQMGMGMGQMTSPGMGAPMGGMGSNQMGFQSWNSGPPQPNKQVDLSAFDNLLSMPSNKPTMSLNQMKQPAMTTPPRQQQQQQQQQKQTTNDISDIFG